MSNFQSLLSREEVDFFVENGYLGPYAAMPPDDMARIRSAIEDDVLTTDGPNPALPIAVAAHGQGGHL